MFTALIDPERSRSLSSATTRYLESGDHAAELNLTAAPRTLRRSKFPASMRTILYRLSTTLIQRPSGDQLALCIQSNSAKSIASGRTASHFVPPPNPPIRRTAPLSSSVSSKLPSLYLTIRIPSGDTAPPPPPQRGSGPDKIERIVPAFRSTLKVPHSAFAARPETKIYPDCFRVVRLQMEPITPDVPATISVRRGFNPTFMIPCSVKAQTAFPSAPNIYIVRPRSSSGSRTTNARACIG